MSNTFLNGVNRILQVNGIIRGDTDTLSSFTGGEHSATSAIAQVAIQSELADIMSRGLLPYEKVINATITLATGVRSYAFPSNFNSLYGEPPMFFDSKSVNHIFEYPGGENMLRNAIWTYRTDPGYPMWWYFEEGTTQQVSFYPVPDATRDGLVLYYDYNSDVNVSASTDVIPLTTNNQFYAFIDAAAIRMKNIFEGKTDDDLEKSPSYLAAKARLFRLIKGKQPQQFYGHSYNAPSPG